MESIIASFESAVSYVVPMVVLLGLLIFVHELGHFLVAKYFKVRVEVFSLGFGPKLLRLKRGDTTYALSAIPLGGYVKMFGDDPTAEIDSAEREHSFLHKPVSARIAVVLAGPLMNFFFAILVFGIVALIGEQALAPRVGDIATNSEAFKAGFRSGDQIVRIADKPIQTWDEVQKTIEANADSKLDVVVKHETGDEQILAITPKLAANKNVLSWSRAVGEVDGLSLISRSAVIGVSDPKSLAAMAGLKTGDNIKTMNGKPVAKWRDLELAMADVQPGSTIAIEAERGSLDEKKSAAAPELVKATLQLPDASTATEDAQRKALGQLGLEYPELFVAGTEKKSPAEKAGLRVGDRLVSIDGVAVQSFEQVANLIHSYGDRHHAQATDASQADTLKVVALRNGEAMNFEISPNAKTRMGPQGKEEKHFEIGIRPLVVDAMPASFQLPSAGVVAALSRGVSQTMHWTSLTVLSFVRLFQNEVSPRNIGGFLSIGQMAKKSWQIGPAQFLNIMAIISINLFILNLLPVPVLDGGHLVFYSIEAIKGAPLSMKKMEIAQQVGLALLLGLMVFALFNDVTRIFSSL